MKERRPTSFVIDDLRFFADEFYKVLEERLEVLLALEREREKEKARVLWAENELPCSLVYPQWMASFGARMVIPELEGEGGL